MKKVNVKVEFDPTPIRHIAIQCPDCGKWFTQYDICKNAVNYKHDLDRFSECECPICGSSFNLGNIDIDQNVDFPEFYKNCMKKKEVWE